MMQNYPLNFNPKINDLTRKRYWSFFGFLIIFLSVSPLQAQEQQVVVEGLVLDAETQQPIPGANILEKGQPNGTMTNLDGEFIINVPENALLEVSYLGYGSVDVEVDGRTEIIVSLKPQASELEEVVLVGYNTVERQHIASAVETLDMDQVTSRPVAKLQEAFSGTIPGVTLLQGSNLPGEVPGTIAIRGTSTLQNADPLVIIDGMEQSLTDIDPNHVKSITVLKDAASAAMYGSRGANGVIIIETERGSTGEFKVNLHSWIAAYDPIDLPNFVDSAEYMRLNNEARGMQGETLLFTEEEISLAENGEYTNTDWLDEIMQKQSFSHNTSASISGGGGIGAFNLMLGHLKENGMNDNVGSERFSARFNTNIKIGEKFELLADFYARRLEVDRLLANDDGHGLFKVAWRMNPTQAVFYESDLENHYILHNGLNPLASINHGGAWSALHDRSTINLRPRYEINENFSLQGNVSYMLNKSATKEERRTFRFFDGDGRPLEVWQNHVAADQGVSESQLTARALLNYENDIRQDKDKIYAVAGTEMMTFNYTDFREVSKLSYFGKVNYSFDNRYILEATARADGSSKFAPGYRWGFFPSGAVSWNVHNENFFAGLQESGAVNRFKFRASYGLIGNENVAPYLWEEVVNTWGWTMRVPNLQFTWEKQKQWNIGLDATFLDHRLDFTVDVYDKHSYDLIYSNFPVPPLTGSYYLTTSVNIGEVRNKGWEVAANWTDRVGEVSYSIGAMLFDNKNEVLKAGYSTSDTLIFKNDPDKIWYRGIAIENYYGFESNGYFQNEQEIEQAASLPNTRPGDIRYVDQNEDGIINDADRVNLGDPFPHWNYAINLSLNYRRWGFTAIGQGVGKRLGRLEGQEGFPVYVDGAGNDMGAPRQYYADNRWTPQTPNSRFPRVWTGSSPNTVLSDVWLSDASFFRIKTLRLDYTIPKIGNNVHNVNIYLNAQDAFTFTDWEGLEPERGGVGSDNKDGNGNYPRMASYSLGVKMSIF